MRSRPRRGARPILTVDALNMMLMAALVFLVLRQVMPIAASIAGGVALSPLDWQPAAPAVAFR